MINLIARVGLTAFLMQLSALPLSPDCHADDPAVAAIARRLASAKKTRIVCFGDSITGSYYHTGGQRAWCEMLGLALQKSIPQANIEMINAGISGHTTVNALARIEQDVLSKHPHLVAVMFGMNDVTRVPLEVFRGNMEAIVQRCQAIGASVLLCTPNSVIQNDPRPNGKLAEYSQAIRQIAEQRQVLLVDVFQIWQQLRDRDPEAWKLLMSDAIHPNMNGHKRFAQSIAEAMTGKRVDLGDTLPPVAALHHTFDRARAGQPIKLIAMPPYDEWMAEVLREHFPDAEFERVVWPIENQSVQQLADWAKRIRSLKPDLVIPAVPVDAPAEDRAAFVEHYEWVLNWSFQFAGRPWDVVPVCPSVQLNLDATQLGRAMIARQIMIGKDVRFIDRIAVDTRDGRELVARWVADQKRNWQAARNELPSRSDHVHLLSQSWPHQAGPRTVKVSIHYPGGELVNVNEQTGIMLTLHNWGGRDCVGTADPVVLADQLNVIAVCVNYLQSGPKPAVENPPPYDFGYLQAIDALRALAFVRAGLRKVAHHYDDGRIFCTGGSGGGNVTLMANKLAPRTFACLIDMCGMNKLSDDIAFNEPGGSRLNARWSRDPMSANYLATDQQEIRFVGDPNHLQIMRRLGTTAKVVVVHGVDDTTCPVADAQEMVANMRSAGLDVDAHFIDADDLDDQVLTSTGHALGNRTQIPLRVAGKYLNPEGSASLRRIGLTDFDRREEIVYQTSNGRYVISYATGIPAVRFEPRDGSEDQRPNLGVD